MTAPPLGRLPPFLSGAHLTGIVFELPCDRGVIETWLRGLGPLTLEPPSSDHHPVYCELWNVHDGALAVGSLDVALGRTLGRALGTYRECMVWIPGVCLRGAPAGSFVAGMLTDSAVARWADVAFGFGYDKRPGRFEHDAEGWRVFGPAGREELHFTETAVPAVSAAVDALERHLAAPLIGVTRRGDFVQSWLRRSLAGATPRAFGGELSLSDYLVPGAQRRYTLGENATAIAFTAMKARVSYPRRVA